MQLLEQHSSISQPECKHRISIVFQSLDTAAHSREAFTTTLYISDRGVPKFCIKSSSLCFSIGDPSFVPIAKLQQLTAYISIWAEITQVQHREIEVHKTCR